MVNKTTHSTYTPGIGLHGPTGSPGFGAPGDADLPPEILRDGGLVGCAGKLLEDEKELAEHIMLVDLGRNDLGRVAKISTVDVNESFTVERYSHVMHIVSEVEGLLESDKDVWDLLMASFPAGTVSGAPKIRAMEIISELEKDKRGPYAGALGLFDFFGNIEVCITLRTLVLKDGVASVQSGGGIVYDSIPAFQILYLL